MLSGGDMRREDEEGEDEGGDEPDDAALHGRRLVSTHGRPSLLAAACGPSIACPPRRIPGPFGARPEGLADVWSAFDAPRAREGNQKGNVEAGFMSGWRPIAASVPQRLFELVHTGEGRLHSALVARMCWRAGLSRAASISRFDPSRPRTPEDQLARRVCEVDGRLHGCGGPAPQRS
jgi:hypothetical protein